MLFRVMLVFLVLFNFAFAASVPAPLGLEMGKTTLKFERA
jgi:hypothetical protein